MKFIGNCFVYFGLFNFFIGSGLYGKGFSWNSFLISLMFGIPPFLFGKWLVDLSEENKQKTIDITATKGAPDQINSSGAKYFLYLRPFETTGKFRLSEAHLNLFAWELHERDGFDDLERVLARATKDTAQLVCLGAQGEHRGAARVTMGENTWKPAVEKWMDNATRIFVLPAANAGTMWEIERLRDKQLLERTIFIMPPKNGAYFETSRDVSGDWVLLLKAGQHRSIAFPSFTPQGCFFALSKNGTVVTHLEPIPFPTAENWFNAIVNFDKKILQPRHDPREEMSRRHDIVWSKPESQLISMTQAAAVVFLVCVVFGGLIKGCN